MLFLRDEVFLFLTILRENSYLHGKLYLISGLYAVDTIWEIVIWNNGRPTLAQVPVMQVSVAALRNFYLNICIQTRNGVSSSWPLCPFVVQTILDSGCTLWLAPGFC
jgi:hypothetical protein